jgi:hypothetical protein
MDAALEIGCNQSLTAGKFTSNGAQYQSRISSNTGWYGKIILVKYSANMPGINIQNMVGPTAGHRTWFF